MNKEIKEIFEKDKSAGYALDELDGLFGKRFWDRFYSLMYEVNNETYDLLSEINRETGDIQVAKEKIMAHMKEQK